jgi:hypothetical protein
MGLIRVGVLRAGGARRARGAEAAMGQRESF